MIEKKETLWQEAALMLKMNTGNIRPVDRSVVAKYAKDMETGAWGPCDTLITFKDGVLINGQHRLEAQVMAKATVTWLIDFDWDGGHGNIGKPMSAGTSLKLKGIPNYNKVSTMMAVYLCSNEGEMVTTSHKQSPERSAQAYFNDPAGVQSVIHLPYVKSHGGCTAAYYALLEAGVPLDAIKQFAEAIYSGEGFKGEPCYELSRRLNRPDRLFPGQVMGLVLDAWNQLQAGKTGRLTPRLNGDRLPEIRKAS